MSHSHPSMPERLRVGVSIYVRKDRQSIWENGIFQNCIFLVMLLMRSPRISQTYLVAGGGDGTPDDARVFLADAPVPIIDMAAASTMLDVMIEMSAQLDSAWVVNFRERGGKVVSMRVGNDYVIDIERMIFELPPGMLVSGAPYDEVWTLPQYETTCAPYYRSVMRAPVRTMPHLWSPMLLQREAARLPPGRTFGYQPGRRRWRLGIFEPNICMVKTSHIPLLSCESAHRSHPDLTERVWAYNTRQMVEHPTFQQFAKELDIVRHGLVSFEVRYPFCQVVAADVDAIVAHHWENAQNYLYYEALFGGYPLIHNSGLIGDCGYRYRDFDCEDGGAAISRAYTHHDENLASYRHDAARLLAELDPESEANVHVYTEALCALYARA